MINSPRIRQIETMQPIALYYDQAGYVESNVVNINPTRSGPTGLMGRQVAGKEFLDAYLRHGKWSELVALTRGATAQKSLAEYCAGHPSSQHRQRRLRMFDAGRFHDQFLAEAPASVLHFPNPADPACAWARQTGEPHRIAFSGVTHTLCSERAVEVLRGLVTDPWEKYDRLICTSSAVRQMVNAVTDTFSEYLRDRHGGEPAARIGLETIPLGVNTDRFRPPMGKDRLRVRRDLQISEEEFVVLFVGRLSHHAKAHPYPMFRAASIAAERTGKTIRLLLCGWSSSDAVSDAFRTAADSVAENVRVDLIDGLDPAMRFDVWKAADVFVSLVDNIQETFGLVIVEAMASGLPVIASDWNGYRDLVTHEETGFLIPTSMLENSLPDLTSRLLTHEINYDHFLARATQTVRVCSDSAANALIRLCENAELRIAMGAAGRRRAVSMFDWSQIIRQYEAMWQDQELQRQEMQKLPGPRPAAKGPAAYPPLDISFRGYPACWLNQETVVVADQQAVRRLAVILRLDLMTHEAGQRCTDAQVLGLVLDSAINPGTLQQCSDLLCRAGVPRAKVNPTLAWLLKYDLLIPVASTAK